MEKETIIQAIKDGHQRAINELYCSQGDQATKVYLKSYPFLLKASETLCEDAKTSSNTSQHAFVAIAHMVYGWMQTILDNCDFEQLSGETFLSALEVDGSEKAHKFVCRFENSPIHNSWVGLSKTLHFINPEFFPIWDSNVARALKIDSQHQMTKRSLYCTYINHCHSILESSVVSKQIGDVREHFRVKLGYEVTELRALEFILFVAGRNI